MLGYCMQPSLRRECFTISLSHEAGTICRGKDDGRCDGQAHQIEGDFLWTAGCNSGHGNAQPSLGLVARRFVSRQRASLRSVQFRLWTSSLTQNAVRVSSHATGSVNAQFREQRYL